MTENEITKAITESMKPVIERMQGILKPELQKPEKSDAEKVSDMITAGTKKVLADKKEREEAQIRRNLITWGGVR